MGNGLDGQEMEARPVRRLLAPVQVRDAGGLDGGGVQRARWMDFRQLEIEQTGFASVFHEAGEGLRESWVITDLPLGS